MRLTRLICITPALASALFAYTASAEVEIDTDAASWVNCASEGDDCKPSTTSSLITMRYGHGDDYTYVVTKGLSKIPCKNDWGDPSKGNDKACAYTTANLLAVPEDDTFQHGADEGHSFELTGSGKLHWIRYGTGGQWAYTLMLSGEEQKVDCDNDYFGFDPVKGSDKVCQWGDYYTLGAETLTECASEGQTCAPSVTTPVLARYGTDKQYDWRFVHSGQTSFKCDNTYFGVDPIHEDKRCWYQPIDAAVVSSLGVWSRVGSCQGAGCSIKESVSFGTSRTSTWSTSAEWSTTVTASVEAGLEIEGVGVKANESVSTSFALSTGYQNAVTQSETTTIEADCTGIATTSNRQLYQFRTTTVTSCLQNGVCDGTTYTADYVCASDPGADYKGPQCLPGYCADQNCTTCTYGDS